MADPNTQDDQLIESLLVEGIESGEPIVLNQAEWQRIRADIEQQSKTGQE